MVAAMAHIFAALSPRRNRLGFVLARVREWEGKGDQGSAAERTIVKAP